MSKIGGIFSRKSKQKLEILFCNDRKKKKYVAKIYFLCSKHSRNNFFLIQNFRQKNGGLLTLLHIYKEKIQDCFQHIGGNFLHFQIGGKF